MTRDGSLPCGHSDRSLCGPECLVGAPRKPFEMLVYPSGEVERIRNNIRAIVETGFCKRCHASGRLLHGRCIPCSKIEDPL